MSFKTQNDANRHKATVHDKTTPYFCRESGCRRVKGFSRKDNFEAHLRNVHGIETNNCGRGPALHSLSMTRELEPEDTRKRDVSLRSLSRRELIEMFLKEREKCDVERRKRQELEAKLGEIRDKYEEREGMLLKLPVKG